MADGRRGAGVVLPAQGLEPSDSVGANILRRHQPGIVPPSEFGPPYDVLAGYRGVRNAANIASLWFGSWQ
jgi:hypothetical protein